VEDSLRMAVSRIYDHDCDDPLWLHHYGKEPDARVHQQESGTTWWTEYNTDSAAEASRATHVLQAECVWRVSIRVCLETLRSRFQEQEPGRVSEYTHRGSIDDEYVACVYHLDP
jgi:hypothetical protein